VVVWSEKIGKSKRVGSKKFEFQHREQRLKAIYTHWL
jgi:hypothetical protein